MNWKGSPLKKKPLVGWFFSGISHVHTSPTERPLRPLRSDGEEYAQLLGKDQPPLERRNALLLALQQTQVGACVSRRTSWVPAGWLVFFFLGGGGELVITRVGWFERERQPFFGGPTLKKAQMISPTACGAVFSARTTPQSSQNLVEPWWNPH